MFKFITMIFVSLFLVACGTTAPIVAKTKKEAVVVPDSFFKEPDAPTPPDREAYIKANPKERETMLAQYIQSLHGVIKDYKDTLKSVYDSMKTSEKLINEGTKP